MRKRTGAYRPRSGAYHVGDAETEHFMGGEYCIGRLELKIEVSRQDREWDLGCIPRCYMARRNAAGVNGEQPHITHGAPPTRMTPKGCLGSSVLVLLPSLQKLHHKCRTQASEWHLKSATLGWHSTVPPSIL